MYPQDERAADQIIRKEMLELETITATKLHNDVSGVCGDRGVILKATGWRGAIEPGNHQVFHANHTGHLPCQLVIMTSTIV